MVVVVGDRSYRVKQRQVRKEGISKMDWSQRSFVAAGDPSPPASPAPAPPGVSILSVQGRIVSYGNEGLERYSMFRAHDTGVRQLLMRHDGILSISANSVGFTTRGGMPTLRLKYAAIPEIPYPPEVSAHCSFTSLTPQGTLHCGLAHRLPHRVGGKVPSWRPAADVSCL